MAEKCFHVSNISGFPIEFLGHCSPQIVRSQVVDAQPFCDALEFLAKCGAQCICIWEWLANDVVAPRTHDIGHVTRCEWCQALGLLERLF